MITPPMMTPRPGFLDATKSRHIAQAPNPAASSAASSLTAASSSEAASTCHQCSVSAAQKAQRMKGTAKGMA